MGISINGAQTDLPADARVSLLDLLREHLYLSGTKKGGSRHRLLIRRQMATIIIEMLRAGNVNDPTCHNWR
jgi:hypothetical protein